MTTAAGPAAPATPRQVADAYVDAVCDLDPVVATSLGTRPGDDRLPDLGPAGPAAEEALDRATLAELDRVLAAGPSPADDAVERRCARLLRERLGAQLGLHEAGEAYRSLNNLFSPLHSVRQVFLLMPASTEEDWSVLARRLARVPEAYQGYRATLEEGARRGLFAAPRQVATVVGQLAEWRTGRFFGSLAAAGPEALSSDLDAAARAADGAVDEMRAFLRDEYAPRAAGPRTPSAGSGTPSPSAAGPAPTWAEQDSSRTSTPGGGTSTGGSCSSSVPRPARSCPVPGRRRPGGGSRSTDRPSRAWRPSARGSSR